MRRFRSTALTVGDVAGALLPMRCACRSLSESKFKCSTDDRDLPFTFASHHILAIAHQITVCEICSCAGLGPDSKLTALFTGIRTLRVADGPDIVHLNTVAKAEIDATKNQTNRLGKYISGVNKNIEKCERDV